MLKAIKYLVITVIALTVLAVATAAAALFWLQNADHKTLVPKLIKNASGWQTEFDSLHVKVFPHVLVDAKGLRVLPLQGDTDVMTAESLHVEADLLPMLLASYIDKIEVVSPKIQLVRNDAGKANFEPVRETRSQAAKRQNGAAFDVTQLLKFGEVNIQNGQFSSVDQKAGSELNIPELNVVLENVSGNAKRGAIQANINGLPLQANIDMDLSSGKTIPTNLKVQVRENSINFSGNLREPTGNASLEGNLDIVGPSLLRIADGLKLAVIPPEFVNQKLALSGQVKANQNTIEFKGTTFQLGQNKLVGDVRMAMGVPSDIRANLSADSMDLNWHPACAAQAAGKGSAAKSANPPATPWNNNLIDTSAAAGINADLNLNLKRFACGTNKFDELKVVMSLQNQQLKLTQLTADMSGKGAVNITADLSLKGGISGNVKFSANKVAPEILNPTLGQYLQAPLTASADLNMAGNSSQALVSSLNGKVAFSADQGTLRGISLKSFVDTLRNLAQGQFSAASPQELNDFKVKADIDQGVARLTEFLIDTSDMTVNGEGKADLANWTINTKFTTESPLVNLPPVLVRGSLNKPQIVPDLMNAETIGTAVGAAVGGPVGAAVGNALSGFVSGDNASVNKAVGDAINLLAPKQDAEATAEQPATTQPAQSTNSGAAAFGGVVGGLIKGDSKAANDSLKSIGNMLTPSIMKEPAPANPEPEPAPEPEPDEMPDEVPADTTSGSDVVQESTQ